MSTIDTIKSASYGRWVEILTELGADPSRLVDKHGTCPFCGGNNRFRFDNKDGRGTFICSQCGAGDGFEFVARLNGLNCRSQFSEVAKLVDGVLGVRMEQDGGNELFRKEYLRTGNISDAYRKAFGDKGDSKQAIFAKAKRLAQRLGLQNVYQSTQNEVVNGQNVYQSTQNEVVNGQQNVYQSTQNEVVNGQNVYQSTQNEVVNGQQNVYQSTQNEVVNGQQNVYLPVATEDSPPLEAYEEEINRQYIDSNNQVQEKKSYTTKDALKIWEMAIPDKRIASYLASRAITIEAGDSRYLPAKNAIISLIRNGQGEPIAIQRTFLNPNADPRKAMLGPAKGGAVRLGEIQNDTIAIGEGIETCLSFQQATGITAWACLTEGGLRGVELPSLEETPNIFILADVDEEKIVMKRKRRVGQEAARATAKRLGDAGYTVAIVWPGDPDGKEKVDFNDLLKNDPTGASIRERLEEAKKNILREDRPTIFINGGELHQVVENVEAQLFKQYGEEIFQRARQLVRLEHVFEAKISDPHAKKLSIIIVDPMWIVIEATRIIKFLRFDHRMKEYFKVDCPFNIAHSILKIKNWKFYNLMGILGAPTIRPDGTVLEQPGYDLKTGMFYDPNKTHFPKIPNHPTHEDAIEALATLEEVLKDFAFKSETHKSAALAAILTALVRRSVRSAPMFGFSAPKMASGKSLLADVVSLIATGRQAAVMNQSTDPDEERKRVFSILLSGQQIVVIDNIERQFSSDLMCSILTQEAFQERMLGENDMDTVSTTVTWLATGNNLAFDGDMSTRVILIQLDPNVDRPEERSFDRNLYTWIPENRANLVVAAITALRAFIVAGKPQSGLPTFGRFEEWAQLIRAALVWCGYQDPCITREDVEQVDSVRITLGSLLNAWYDAFGSQSVTVAELITQAKLLANPARDYLNSWSDVPEPNSDLLNALIEVAEGHGGNGINNRRLGKFLSKYNGRIEGKFKLTRDTYYHRTAAYWKVIRQNNDEHKLEEFRSLPFLNTLETPQNYQAEPIDNNEEKNHLGVMGVMGVSLAVARPPIERHDNPQYTSVNNVRDTCYKGRDENSLRLHNSQHNKINMLHDTGLVNTNLRINGSINKNNDVIEGEIR